MNRFSTGLDFSYHAKRIFITDGLLFLILTGLNLFSFTRPEGGTTMFLFFEGMILFAIFLAVIMPLSQTKTVLRFEGNKLFIDGVKHYVVFDVPASDFLLSQTEAGKKKDIGSMKIKNTIFSFKGIQNFSKMREYITENFEKR